MMAGWDRYLLAHETGTHSVIGAAACGMAAAAVAMSLSKLRRRPVAYGPLVMPALVGAFSHVVGDLLSGASIRVGWPVFDTRVTSIGVVGMGEPIVVIGFSIAALAMWMWKAHRSHIAAVVVSLFAVLTLEKSILRERAELAYRQHAARAAAAGAYLVEPVWGSMTRWRVFDRTDTAMRAWTVDVAGGVELDLEVPLATGDDTLIAASLQWDTVQNFLRAHDFAFAVASERRVEWSDPRYCASLGQGVVPTCAVWAGGEFGARRELQRLVVRVGNLVQTREPE